MLEGKVVCFAGHRFFWKFIGVENNLRCEIEKLILEGYNIFLDGGIGDFDKLCSKIVFELKEKYKYIKIIRVLTYYKFKKEKIEISGYDELIYPELENCYYKQIITKKNKWMVDNSDVVVCCIRDIVKSGTYNTVKYAEKQNKIIIKV